MANEIVKYANRLNSIPFRRFKPREMDLFFAIASRVYNKGTEKVELTFDEIKRLSNYTQHGKTFIADLDRTFEKLLKMDGKTDDGVKLVRFLLFSYYEIDRDKRAVTIAVNVRFKEIFNELKNWTRFSLEQFASLKSGYSKTMFRLLKQFRTTGWRQFTMDEFRYLLDVPESYRPTNIDQVVLKPIKAELPAMFKGLVIRKIRSGQGNKITGYRLEWTPEAANADDSTSGKIRGPQKRHVGHKKRRTPQPAWADPNYKAEPAKPTDPATKEKLQKELAKLQEGRRKYQAETAAAAKGGK